MNPVKARDARRALTAKGFSLASSRRDHEVYFYYVDGKKTSWFVKISHGASEMIQREIRGSARVCGMMKGEDMFKVLSCDHAKPWVDQEYQKHAEKLAQTRSGEPPKHR